MHNCISLIFFILALICKSAADKIKSHWYKSIFKNIKNEKIRDWFDPKYWNRKWKDGDPNKGERFWGSSRWFVFLTDAWHMINSIMVMFFTFALTFNPLYEPFVNKLVDSFIYIAISTSFFELFFSKIFESNKKDN